VNGVMIAVELASAPEAMAMDQEKRRAEQAEVQAQIERVRSRLANPGFTDKAPPTVVAGARKQLADLEAKLARVIAAGSATAES
jgi:valyl-tRNA synthetase